MMPVDEVVGSVTKSRSTLVGSLLTAALSVVESSDSVPSSPSEMPMLLIVVYAPVVPATLLANRLLRLDSAVRIAGSLCKPVTVPAVDP